MTRRRLAPSLGSNIFCTYSLQCLVALLLAFNFRAEVVTSGFVITWMQSTKPSSWSKKTTLQLQKQPITTGRSIQVEPLLDGEYALYQRNEPPITTLTWFRGDAVGAAKHLENRLKLIVDQNRWLGGSIFTVNNKAYLTFDQNVNKSLNPRNFLTLLQPHQSPIRYRRTPLDRLGRNCKELLLKNGPTEPLFQITVVPCRNNPKTHFALIVALSHIVGDGHTYYKLLSMLCCDDGDVNKVCNVEPLIYKRISTTADQQAAAMGQNNYDFFAKPGPAFFLNYFSGMLKSRLLEPVANQQQSVFALVDEHGMRKEKVQAVSTNESLVDGSSVDDVDFVSTNDVLTSWFLKTTKPNVGAMAINFRNRLPGHTDLHAGNYESIIVYNGPSDYATPNLIRKSLDTYRRTVTIHDPLPNFIESLGLTSGLVTNWSSFAKPNTIPGCLEELHVPLYDAFVPTGAALMIIFRAGPNKGLGVFMAGTQDMLREVGGGFSRQFKKKPAFLSSRPLL